MVKLNSPIIKVMKKHFFLGFIFSFLLQKFSGVRFNGLIKF